MQINLLKYVITIQTWMLTGPQPDKSSKKNPFMKPQVYRDSLLQYLIDRVKNIPVLLWFLW